MPQHLRKHDPDLIEFGGEHGGILLSPGYQGRIFAHIDGQLVHRLDEALLDGPPKEGFNNVGGNYVFPAPEGGPYAFNYLPSSPDWVVQPAFNTQNPRVTARDAVSAVVEKEVTLENRQGVNVAFRFRRTLRPLEVDPAARALDLRGIRYEVEDEFEPRDEYSVDRVLLAPWSLEQFPGGPGVTSFAKVTDPRRSLNFDYYSDPSSRVSYGPNCFLFPLGDSRRHQVGVRVESDPAFVGALDTARSMLFLRRTPPQDGTYFNIADNDQPAGPFSAADRYSVFDGGELGFFELETIGAMAVRDGRVGPSRLVSETLVLQGPLPALEHYLGEREGLRLEPARV